MPVTISGKKYFRTAEVCREVGISRNTLYRWSTEEETLGVQHRDFRGWRLFTQEQLDSLLKKTASVTTVPIHGSME
jgi:transposase-like protein